MTRKGTPRPGNGGARVGAGRKPTTMPLKEIELDADTARMLAELTIYFRSTGAGEISQTELIAAIIAIQYSTSIGSISTASPQVGGEN